MKSVQITAYFPEPVADMLRKGAINRKVSVSGYLVRLVEAAHTMSAKDSFTLADLERSEKRVVGRYDSADELIRSLDEDRKNRGIC
jgi:hypothetical protein